VAVDAPKSSADAPAEPDKPGRIARARVQAEARWDRVVAARQRVTSVDVAFQVFENDRDKGGGIMAGAVAFRMFVAMVPATLVIVIVLGAVVDVSGENAYELAHQVGLTGIAASTIKTASDASTASTIVTFLLSVLALFLASSSLAKTLRVVNFLLWDLPMHPLRRSWRAALTVIGLFVGLAALSLLLAKARAESGPVGLGSILVAMLGFFALWLFISSLLPHRGGLLSLLPGAALVAVGVEVLHLVTVYYVSRKLWAFSDRYGALGASVVILGWLYLLGRLVVGSAALDAAVWRRRQRRPLPPPLPPPRP
jgi:uncharacterized BrkB/YihY/UPF0761 family membrane protein